MSTQKISRKTCIITVSAIIAETEEKPILGLLFSHLCEALAAIDRPVRLWLKRNFCFLAARSASSCVILTGSASNVLSGVTARLAALGLILEAALCIEFLLTCGECEFLSAFFTY